MLFIFGCSRTASKAYMYFFNQHTDYNVSRELHLHKIFSRKSLLQSIRRFKKHGDFSSFLKELEQLNNASYWKSGDFHSTLFEKFYNENKPKRLNYRSFIDLLLKFDMLQKNKKLAGAKFPIYIGYSIFIRKWFKDSKYIFLARQPEGIAFSQFNKHKLKKPLARLKMLVYTSIMFNFTVLWGMVFNPKMSTFIAYEDFKSNRSEVIREVCRFLDIRYTSEMASLPVLGSKIQDNSSVYHMNVIEKILLNILTFPFSYLYNSKIGSNS